MATLRRSSDALLDLLRLDTGTTADAEEDTEADESATADPSTAQEDSLIDELLALVDDLVAELLGTGPQASTLPAPADPCSRRCSRASRSHFPRCCCCRPRDTPPSSKNSSYEDCQSSAPRFPLGRGSLARRQNSPPRAGPRVAEERNTMKSLKAAAVLAGPDRRRFAAPAQAAESTDLASTGLDTGLRTAVPFEMAPLQESEALDTDETRLLTTTKEAAAVANEAKPVHGDMGLQA
ncbi:hypothetical protein GCM10023238_00910 [Streptomyces heliomycini]